MSLSNNPGEQDPNNEEQNDLTNKDDQFMWDNDTYGHSPDTSAFKRKNEPDEKHIEHLKEISDESNLDSSKQLNNINLSENDLSTGSSDEEKGIGGKEL